MQNINQLRAEIDTIESIKLIADVLGDIATTRLKATRNSIEQNIEFFQEIAQVYRVVKEIALRSKIYTAYQQAKNGKTVVILLSSNDKFHGSLDTELTKFFIDQSPNLKADLIVVGRSGLEILKVKKFTYPFSPVLFIKDFPTLEELKKLQDKVFKYSKILIFHTKFVTVLNQSPTVTDITASDIEIAPDRKHLYYILEPEIKKMIAFFEGQILILLFQAVFLEVDLARLAARMISMNQAGDSASKLLEDENKDMLKLKKTLINLRIQETYAGMIKLDN